MAKRLVTNDNATDFQYAEPDAYLNIDVELANGKKRSLNYYEDRKSGEFKPVGIKLYKEIKLHAWLIEMLESEGISEEDLELSLRVRFVKPGTKSEDDEDEFELARR